MEVRTQITVELDKKEVFDILTKHLKKEGYQVTFADPIVTDMSDDSDYGPPSYDYQFMGINFEVTEIKKKS